MNIKFFKPYITNNELKYIRDILKNNFAISGDGKYTKKVSALLEERYGIKKLLLTTSGTTALEMAVELLNLKEGDEIIVPSFTFSSTANAILRKKGLKVNFAEINEKTLNIDFQDVLNKVTKRTKAIIVVHYAGVACDMDTFVNFAKKEKIKIIEDAAQAIEAKYKNKYLGTIGDFGCFSFHETKNIVSGEGGALLINKKNKKIFEKAEIIREKGTNRNKFFRGEIDKYTWVDVGSSYLPSDILAAFLFAQLEYIEEITKKRIKVYNRYQRELSDLEKKGLLILPRIPEYATHNAHIFHIRLNESSHRDFILRYLHENGIKASFHYIPLHSSPQGRKVGYKAKDFPITEKVSSTLIRLPIYAGMKNTEISYVIDILKKGISKL